MSVFDLPPERLLDLSDAELRELVARLCEAERERQGGQRNEVRWGGSQTAPDGGLDVVVEAGPAFESTAALPCRLVGIQVKKNDLQPAAISDEMRPNGALRPVIEELAGKVGAYLIASVGANCSELMLERRKTAMREAVVDSPNSSCLVTRFVDRNALARWTSAHPGVTLWLRARLGLPVLNGWHPHGRWSSTPAGKEDDLICEPGLRIAVGREAPIEELTEALAVIRQLVRNGEKAVRITGLSGVGKSRIVQALFEKVGVDPLPASQAIYADAGRDSDPSPSAMLDHLSAQEKPAVLVVDNCPPQTHQALAEALAKADGAVRLITVEYDVRADRPHETDVVRIEAEGPDIVSVLLERRRPGISRADARRLAELAQGNARLGLALAEAAPDAGTLSSFEDNALFERLFWQRGERDPYLARAAQALSLVYSFDVEGGEKPDELAFLGKLAELSRSSMHRCATTLLDRGLAQARGHWRAVLPHALANRLAAQALRELPCTELADAFADPNARRLRGSFARRLAYMHTVPEARRIILSWMEPNGPLYGPNQDFDLLLLVCHLAPRETLDAIGPTTPSATATFDLALDLNHILRILVRIAYSEEHFEESCVRLIDLAVATGARHQPSATQALQGLFGLYLSGTTARTETRVAAARRMIVSSEPGVAEIGLAMVASALRTGHWTGLSVVESDARTNCWGWQPETSAEVVHWYSEWIDLVAWVALSCERPIRDSARKILAEHLGNVWCVSSSLHSRVEKLTFALQADEPWVEGWHGLRQTLYRERLRAAKNESTMDMIPLRRLIAQIEPSDLLTRARAELCRDGRYEDESDADELSNGRDPYDRHQDRLEEIGKELAGSMDLLSALSEDLFNQSGVSFRRLGMGLALGADAPLNTWNAIRDLFLSNPDRASELGVLGGFIEGLDDGDPETAEAIRRDCLSRKELRRIYPNLVPPKALSLRELNRLLDVAADGEMDGRWFERFVWREEYEISAHGRLELLRAMLGASRGPDAVLMALRMLRQVEKDDPHSWPPDLRALGLDAALAIIRGDAGQSDQNVDYNLQRTVDACILPDDNESAIRVLDALAERARQGGSLYSQLEKLLPTIAARAPEIFLEHAFSDDSNDPLNLCIGCGSSPLNQIEPQFLVHWCERGNSDRWLQIAGVMEPFGPRATVDSNDAAESITPQARALLDAAPDPVALLGAYVPQLVPSGWGGSLAEAIARRLPALEELTQHPQEVVRNAASRHLVELRRRIELRRRDEREREQERDQRFE